MSKLYYDPILNKIFLDHGLIVEWDSPEGEVFMLGDDERDKFFKQCIDLGELE